MSLNFKSQLGGAIDSGTGLTIRPPRMLPASPPRYPDEVEYQYTFYRGGEPYDGLGLFGTDVVVEKNGHRECVSTLDLGSDQLLNSVFRLKRDLGDDDDFAFLQGLAYGLIAVFENHSDSDDGRYVVVTNAALLAARGITVPDSAARLDSGQIVLAEIFAPAHTGS
jgi:hypothetical protein